MAHTTDNPSGTQLENSGYTKKRHLGIDANSGSVSRRVKRSAFSLGKKS